VTCDGQDDSLSHPRRILAGCLDAIFWTGDYVSNLVRADFHFRWCASTDGLVNTVVGFDRPSESTGFD